MGAIRHVIEAPPSALLHWARRREQAGDLIGSGVCLRAAIHRQLLVMGRVHDCLPSSRKDRQRAAAVVAALYSARVITKGDHKWIQDAIEAGNAAAHLNPVDRSALRGGLLVLGMMIDEWPNGKRGGLVAGGAV